jgi:hypothetical protein
MEYFMYFAGLIKCNTPALKQTGRQHEKNLP